MCAEQTVCRAGEAAFQELCPSCLARQVLKNEELSLELLSLTNARSTDSNHHHSRALATEPTAEPGRVTMHRPPAQKVKVRASLPFSQSELFGEQGSDMYLLLSLPKTARRRGCP